MDAEALQGEYKANLYNGMSEADAKAAAFEKYGFTFGG